MDNTEHVDRPQARELYPRIVSQPDILYGKPVIEGTRISVEVLLDNIASGATFDDLLAAYPSLAHDDLVAAVEYAAQLAAHARGNIERAVS